MWPTFGTSWVLVDIFDLFGRFVLIHTYIYIFPQTVLALRGSGGIKKECWWNIVASARPTGHARCQKNNAFLSILKKNGAGVRVLRSPAPVFDECFS